MGDTACCDADVEEREKITELPLIGLGPGSHALRRCGS